MTRKIPNFHENLYDVILSLTVLDLANTLLKSTEALPRSSAIRAAYVLDVLSLIGATGISGIETMSKTTDNSKKKDSELSRVTALFIFYRSTTEDSFHTIAQHVCSEYPTRYGQVSEVAEKVLAAIDIIEHSEPRL